MNGNPVMQTTCTRCIQFMQRKHRAVVTLFVDSPGAARLWLQGPEAALETQIVSKMCCLQLVELMYSRLHQSELKGLDSRINSVYCGGKPVDGKELTKTVTT